MKVFTVGFCKTGTKTLDQAYRILGYKVSTSGRSLTELREDWIRFFNGDGSPEDLQRMYDGYDTASDSPAFLYWKYFVKAFPDIKLVLATRDADSWWKSFKNQFITYNASAISFPLSIFSPKARRWLGFLRRFAGVLFGEEPRKQYFRITLPIFDSDVCRKRYLEFNEDVKKNAPSGQLLILDLKDGWEPLCKFLGKEVPDVPFPHENKNGSITAYRLKHDPFIFEMYTEMYLTLAGITLFFSVLGAVVAYIYAI